MNNSLEWPNHIQEAVHHALNAMADPDWVLVPKDITWDMVNKVMEELNLLTPDILIAYKAMLSAAPAYAAPQKCKCKDSDWSSSPLGYKPDNCCDAAIVSKKTAQPAPELLPCPFCGALANARGGDNIIKYCACKNVDCILWDLGFPISRWNTRVAQPSPTLVNQEPNNEKAENVSCAELEAALEHAEIQINAHSYLPCLDKNSLGLLIEAARAHLAGQS